MYIHMTQLSWMYKNIHIHDLLGQLIYPWNHLFHLRSKSRSLFHYNSQGWRQWNEDHSDLHSLIGSQQQLPIWGGEYWLTHGNEATPPPKKNCWESGLLKYLPDSSEWPIFPVVFIDLFRDENVTSVWVIKSHLWSCGAYLRECAMILMLSLDTAPNFFWQSDFFLSKYG